MPSEAANKPQCTIHVALSGGLEGWTLDEKPNQIVCFPDAPDCSIGELIRAFSEKCLTSTGRRHFLNESRLRSGIIVLVNETDWEFFGDDYEGKVQHRLQSGDVVQFITTLHGG